MENNNKQNNNLPSVNRQTKQTSRNHVLEPVEKGKPENKAKKPSRRRFYRRPKKVAVSNGNKKNLPAKSDFASKQNHNQGHHKQTIAHKLVTTITKLVGQSFKAFILWALFSTALYAVGAYFVFDYCIAQRSFPVWYNILLGFVLFGCYSVFGLIFGLVMALLYTVKSFSDSMGGIIRESINRIKNSIESKIDNITDTVSKHEVADVIRQTFTELSQNIRQYAAKTAAGILTIMLLTGIIFVVRNLLVQSVSKIKNKADFFTQLSAKVALVLAIVLNLTFFAKVLIYAAYFVGFVVFLSQAIIILLVK